MEIKVKTLYSLLLLICIALPSCAQETDGRIVSQISISSSDLKNAFIQNAPNPLTFVISDGQKNVWQPAFQYLDSIEISKITYLSDGLHVKGYIVKPQKKGKYPCIIYNRGGNREFGALNPMRVAWILGELANHGYVIIASQYRGNDGGEGQEEFGGAEVNDIINLIPALSQIEQADTSKIGMYGWSRGGMMTYLAMTKTNRLKAAAVGGAVADHFASIADRPNMETGVIAELVPNYNTNKEAALEKRSAIKWVEKFPKDVPLLILHGTSDWRVKPDQSLQLALELDKHRIPYRLIMFEGADHGIRERREEVMEQLVRWFDRFLKKEEQLPNMEFHGR